LDLPWKGVALLLWVVRFGLLAGVALLASLVAGFVLPARSIDDGLRDFEGDDRDRAEWALAIARDADLGDEFWPDPDAVIERVLTTAYRVERVDECENIPRGLAPEPTVSGPASVPRSEGEIEAMLGKGQRPPQPGNFSYEVRRYTLFGVPYALETEAEAELCDFTL